jgi:succinate-semialdehyde dehydrogenase/glutarate-semialdehyde dehydrogenase
MQSIINQNLVKYASYINGEWCDNELNFRVENPATGKPIGQVSEVSIHEVINAVDAAAQSQLAWQGLSCNERGVFLKRWARLLKENAQDLSQIMHLEQGKSIEEALGEISHSADYIELYADNAESAFRCDSVASANHQQSIVYRRPVGVTTAITPWNFPCSMVIRKASAALAAGCSVVLKPSDLTPFTALAIAELSHLAEMPKGVFNVVVGSDAQAIGEVLTQHPKVAKFSFTGSTPVGKKLLAQCAEGVKRTSMELGGNAPFIVFADADIELAVEAAIASRLRNSGQTCICANRLLIEDSIADSFVEKLCSKVEAILKDSRSGKNISLGPLIDQQAVCKMESLVHNAIQEGAKLMVGGNRQQTEGHFFEATVIDHVTKNMSLFNSEIFGPIFSIVRFEGEQHAVELANHSALGLSGYVYTNNQERQRSIAPKLQVGMLGINEARLSNPAAPFGGVKQSGMGREGGVFGIEEYLDYQYVCTAK